MTRNSKKVGSPSMAQPSNEQQHRRFIETARALECDEGKEAFEIALREIAVYKPVKKRNKDRKIKRNTDNS
jgi:hypothetical protein